MSRFTDATVGESAEVLRGRFAIAEADLAIIRKHGGCIHADMDGMIADFYRWMETLPEYGVFFSETDRMKRVQGLQRSYWSSFLAAEVDDTYIARRRHLGEVHARIGLSLGAYFAAMDHSLHLLLDRFAAGVSDDRERFLLARAVTRLVHLDTAVVVESYSRLTQARISEQTRALIEMSTPVTALWEDILMLPVVGIIDSQRANDMMSSVLARVAETRAKVFIIDISGVSVVDTAVANHIIKITKATRLMGCSCILSGLSPSIAQTIVELGIDVGALQTTATLRDALEEAFRRVGVAVTRGVST